MSKPKYLKLLAVVEEDYKPISGEITFENGTWNCENVMLVKLGDNFTLPSVSALRFMEYIAGVLDHAEGKSNE